MLYMRLYSIHAHELLTSPMHNPAKVCTDLRQPALTGERSNAKETRVRYLKALFLLLVIVGGVNWLLVGLAKIDLVAALTGRRVRPRRT